MKSFLILLILLGSLRSSRAVEPASDLSFRQEVRHSISRGAAWLKARQQPNGSWGNAEHPALTGLALTALSGQPGEATDPASRRGYDFLAGCFQADGGIYVKELPNYNTALSLVALVAAHDSRFDLPIRRARQWLIRAQVDLGEKGKLDTPFDGGIGYGNHYQHSDMNNTLAALEALYYSRSFAGKESPGEAQLDWKAVLHFVQNCQNLPSHNSQPWAGTETGDLGGFVYYPGQSMAGGKTNSITGKISLRSYGSISYAGLLSYLYADLQPQDPRVIGVLDWLRGNYTLEENPGMGAQGYYYYLYLMTKGLNLASPGPLKLANGRSVPWRRDLAMKLINLQRADGSWVNDQGRWWEKEAPLTTSYSLIALEILERGL